MVFITTIVLPTLKTFSFLKKLCSWCQADLLKIKIYKATPQGRLRGPGFQKGIIHGAKLTIWKSGEKRGRLMQVKENQTELGVPKVSL